MRAEPSYRLKEEERRRYVRLAREEGRKKGGLPAAKKLGDAKRYIII
jgi:hypothetical protein